MTVSQLLLMKLLVNSCKSHISVNLIMQNIVMVRLLNALA